jgi:hypothetical protein
MVRRFTVPTDETTTRTVNKPAKLTKRRKTLINSRGQSQANVSSVTTSNADHLDLAGVTNVDFVSRQTAAPHAVNITGGVPVNIPMIVNMPVAPSNANALPATSYPSSRFQEVPNIMPPPPLNQEASHPLMPVSTSFDIQNRRQYLGYQGSSNVMTQRLQHKKQKHHTKRYQQHTMQMYDAQRHQPPNVYNQTPMDTSLLHSQQMQTSMATSLHHNQQMEMWSSMLHDVPNLVKTAGYPFHQNGVQTRHTLMAANLMAQNNSRPSQQEMSNQTMASQIRPSRMPPPAYPGISSIHPPIMSSQQTPAIQRQQMTRQQNIPPEMVVNPAEPSVMQNSQQVFNKQVHLSTIPQTHRQKSTNHASSSTVVGTHQNASTYQTLSTNHHSHKNALTNQTSSIHRSHGNTPTNQTSSIHRSHTSTNQTLSSSHLSHQNVGLSKNRVSSEHPVSSTSEFVKSSHQQHITNQTSTRQNVGQVLQSDRTQLDNQQENRVLDLSKNSPQVSRSDIIESSTSGSSDKASPDKDVRRFLQMACEKVSSFIPSSESSSSVEVSRSSSSNQNQAVETSIQQQTSCESEVLVVNTASSSETQGEGSTEQNEGADLLSAARELAKKISSPGGNV